MIDYYKVGTQDEVAKREAANATRNLLQTGSWTLASGAPSFFKIECDALSTADIETCASLLVRRLPAFGQVEGVPRGGLRLAQAMQQYVTSGPLLIVDDVVTTGGSMERHRAGRDAIGACIFLRSWKGGLSIVPGFVDWFEAALFVMMPEREEQMKALPPPTELTNE